MENTNELIKKMKEEFMKNNKLSDEELANTVAGVKTGEYDENGEVYIAFPSIVGFLSDYYSTSEIETLVINYSNYKSIIKMYITDDVRNAVIDLYKKENKSIPSNVKDMLGIK